jgi:hypothetical protein
VIGYLHCSRFERERAPHDLQLAGDHSLDQSGARRLAVVDGTVLWA